MALLNLFLLKNYNHHVPWIRSLQFQSPQTEKLARPVFNNMVGPQILNLPLGVNLAPSDKLCLLGGMFTPSFTLTGEHTILFRRMEG
jgi:hypothetical protein